LEVAGELHKVSILTAHMKEAGYRRVKLLLIWLAEIPATTGIFNHAQPQNAQTGHQYR